MYQPEAESVKRTIQSRLIWLFLVTTSSLLLAGWVYQVYQRPFTSIGVCVLVLALLWYTASDDAASSTPGSMVHRKGEFEVVFWVVFALFGGVVFFMFPDSPIVSLIRHVKSAILSWTEDAVNAAVDIDTKGLPVPASITLVAVITLYTLHFARLRQREELLVKPEVFTRKLSANLLATSTEERVISVKEAVRVVDSCLRELDHDFLPSSLSRFIRYSKDLLNEAKILRVFREAGGNVAGSTHESPENSDSDEFDPRGSHELVRSPHGFYLKPTQSAGRLQPFGFSKEEYSYLVMKCDLALLLYKIKDHSVAAHRRQLIRILCHDRLSLLTTPARAMVLHALQKIKLSSDRPTMERAVFDILTSCRGHDLTELKAIMDAKGNYHSLHKLVFHDIKTPTTRKLIADHILQEARRIGDASNGQFNSISFADDLEFQISRSKSLPSGLFSGGTATPPISVQHNPYIFSDPTTIGANAGPRLLIQTRTKIISDVDDTLECSGGMYPAGVDRRYERHTPYPGVGMFYREIDVCGSGDVLSSLPAKGWPVDADFATATTAYICNLVFLSARPHVYKDLSELRSYAKFASLLKRGILHGTPSLLPGSLIGGKEFVLRDRLEPLAENKFSNFREYASLYPEYEYVFVGDNGQADVRAVARMLELPFVKIKAIFIHVVQPLSLTYGMPKDLSKFCFFTNYVQASLFAYQREIISAAGLLRITVNAVEQFEQIKGIGGDVNQLPAKSSAINVASDTPSSLTNANVSKQERIKTEQLRREINHFVQLVEETVHRDLNNATQLLWSTEMESAVRELMFVVRPIEAPRYFANTNRVACKYGAGEVEGFSADTGYYAIKMFGTKNSRPLKCNALLFSYYMDVKEDEQATSKWKGLSSLSIFGRRMSHSDFEKSRASASGRESPRSYSSQVI